MTAETFHQTFKTLKDRAIEKDGYAYTTGVLSGFILLLSHDLTPKQREQFVKEMDAFTQKHLL
jgi:hypothetical protein